MSSFKQTFLSLDGKGWFVLRNILWQEDNSSRKRLFAVFGGIDRPSAALSQYQEFSPQPSHPQAWGMEGVWRGSGGCAPQLYLFENGESRVTQTPLAVSRHPGIRPYRAFSPDSQRLFWMSLEPVTTPNPADNFELVTYADGKPVAHPDRGAAAQRLLLSPFIINPYGQLFWQALSLPNVALLPVQCEAHYLGISTFSCN
jgi:hypothetical protein